MYKFIKCDELETEYSKDEIVELYSVAGNAPVGFLVEYPIIGFSSVWQVYYVQLPGTEDYQIALRLSPKSARVELNLAMVVNSIPEWKDKLFNIDFTARSLSITGATEILRTYGTEAFIENQLSDNPDKADEPFYINKSTWGTKDFKRSFDAGTMMILAYEPEKKYTKEAVKLLTANTYRQVGGMYMIDKEKANA